MRVAPLSDPIHAANLAFVIRNCNLVREVLFLGDVFLVPVSL